MTKTISMTPLYQTQATAIGGRSGWAASVDGALRVHMALPPALGGMGGDGTNPEQLFAAGYAACFLSAIKSTAEQSHVTITEDANVTATVAIAPREDRNGLTLKLALAVDLPGLERTTAERIVAAAHQACPYSDVLRRNVDVRLTIA